MARVAQNLQQEIQDIMNALSAEQATVGRSEKGRLLAIAITHLETARLFVKETQNL